MATITIQMNVEDVDWLDKTKEKVRTRTRPETIRYLLRFFEDNYKSK
jgi:hypothetical protein